MSVYGIQCLLCHLFSLSQCVHLAVGPYSSYFFYIIHFFYFINNVRRCIDKRKYVEEDSNVQVTESDVDGDLVMIDFVRQSDFSFPMFPEHDL